MGIFRTATTRLWLSTFVLTLSACNDNVYTNNPSQQIRSSWPGCPVITDFFSVYFSVRVLPDDVREEDIPKLAFRPYCHQIPFPGTVFFTADIVDGKLNKQPIGIQVFEQASFTDGKDKGQHAIWEVAAQPYPKGVIETQFVIDKVGQYVMYLSRDGENGATKLNTLKIPLNVGVGFAAKRPIAQIAIVVALIIGMALVAVYQFRQKPEQKKPPKSNAGSGI